MTMTAAYIILLTVIELLQLALTVGIIRRLRATGGGTGPVSSVVIDPSPGWVIDLSADEDSWPVEADAMLQGTTLVALVLHGCPACKQLRWDLEKRQELAVPLYVIGEWDDETNDALASWPHATQSFARPKPLDELPSFDHPSALPALLALQNGVVVAAGYRLIDVEPTVTRLSTNREQVLR